MKLTTVETTIANANHLQDILQTFEQLEYQCECDGFDSDEIHYYISTTDGGYIQIHYNFMRGVCYISTDEDDDQELVLHFSITKRYISD